MLIKRLSSERFQKKTSKNMSNISNNLLKINPAEAEKFFEDRTENQKLNFLWMDKHYCTRWVHLMANHKKNRYDCTILNDKKDLLKAENANFRNFERFNEDITNYSLINGLFLKKLTDVLKRGIPNLDQRINFGAGKKWKNYTGEQRQGRRNEVMDGAAIEVNLNNISSNDQQSSEFSEVPYQNNREEDFLPIEAFDNRAIANQMVAPQEAEENITENANKSMNDDISEINYRGFHNNQGSRVDNNHRNNKSEDYADENSALYKNHTTHGLNYFNQTYENDTENDTENENLDISENNPPREYSPGQYRRNELNLHSQGNESPASNTFPGRHLNDHHLQYNYNSNAYNGGYAEYDNDGVPYQDDSQLDNFGGFRKNPQTGTYLREYDYFGGPVNNQNNNSQKVIYPNPNPRRSSSDSRSSKDKKIHPGSQKSNSARKISGLNPDLSSNQAQQRVKVSRRVRSEMRMDSSVNSSKSKEDRHKNTHNAISGDRRGMSIRERHKPCRDRRNSSYFRNKVNNLNDDDEDIPDTKNQKTQINYTNNNDGHINNIVPSQEKSYRQTRKNKREKSEEFEYYYEKKNNSEIKDFNKIDIHNKIKTKVKMEDPQKNKNENENDNEDKMDDIQNQVKDAENHDSPSRNKNSNSDSSSSRYSRTNNNISKFDEINQEKTENLNENNDTLNISAHGFKLVNKIEKQAEREEKSFFIARHIERFDQKEYSLRGVENFEFNNVSSRHYAKYDEEKSELLTGNILPVDINESPNSDNESKPAEIGPSNDQGTIETNPHEIKENSQSLFSNRPKENPDRYSESSSSSEEFSDRKKT